MELHYQAPEHDQRNVSGSETHMTLREFIRRRHLNSEQLERFFQHEGQELPECAIEDFDKYFVDFKKRLASYADRVLYGKDRLSLFQEMHDLVKVLPKPENENSLRRHGARAQAKKTYELNQSFLSDAEIDLIILKALHEPMSQEMLAQSVLKCTRNTANARIAALQSGKRLGDMRVQIPPAYRGQYESTVHPILLPLNLTEVYVLLCALGDAGQGRDETNPHAVIARDLAEKVYFQLTDYARSRIDDRLDERGVKPKRSTPPTYDFETYRSGKDDAAITKVRRSRNWAYFEKSGERVRITLASIVASTDTYEKSTQERVEYGWLRPGDPTPYLEDSETNPATCFVFERDNDSHSFIALNWKDVIDIEAAPRNSR